MDRRTRQAVDSIRSFFDQKVVPSRPLPEPSPADFFLAWIDDDARREVKNHLGIQERQGFSR